MFFLGRKHGSTYDTKKKKAASSLTCDSEKETQILEKGGWDRTDEDKKKRQCTRDKSKKNKSEDT